MNRLTDCHRTRIAQTMKKRGTVSQRFKGVKIFLVECVHPVIDILKMHFLDGRGLAPSPELTPLKKL